MNAAVLTISDRVSRGAVEDTSGDLLDELLRGDGYDVERRVVADEAERIAASIEELAAGAAYSRPERRACCRRNIPARRNRAALC